MKREIGETPMLYPQL